MSRSGVQRVHTCIQNSMWSAVSVGSIELEATQIDVESRLASIRPMSQKQALGQRKAMHKRETLQGKIGTRFVYFHN